MSSVSRVVALLTATSLLASNSVAAAAEIVRPSASRVSLSAAIQASSAPAATAQPIASCINAGVAAAAAAASAQATPAQPGCLFPVVDTLPVAQPAQAALPVSTVAASAGGIGMLPLLLGLAAVIGGVALLAAGGGGDDADPVSPD